MNTSTNVSHWPSDPWILNDHCNHCFPVKWPWFPFLAMPPLSLLRPIQAMPLLEYPSMKREQSSVTAIAVSICADICYTKYSGWQQSQPLWWIGKHLFLFLSMLEYLPSSKATHCKGNCKSGLTRLRGPQIRQRLAGDPKRKGWGSHATKWYI